MELPRRLTVAGVGFSANVVLCDEATDTVTIAGDLTVSSGLLSMEQHPFSIGLPLRTHTGQLPMRRLATGASTVQKSRTD